MNTKIFIILLKKEHFICISSNDFSNDNHQPKIFAILSFLSPPLLSLSYSQNKDCIFWLTADGFLEFVLGLNVNIYASSLVRIGFGSSCGTAYFGRSTPQTVNNSTHNSLKGLATDIHSPVV